MLSHITVVLFTLGIGWKGTEGVKSCTQKSKCSCETDTGQLISLEGLIRQKVSAAPEEYTWEPCGEFDIGNLKGVSIVLESIGIYSDIGTDLNSYFTVNNGDVNYYLMSVDKARQSLIKLTCSKGDTQWIFTAQGVPFFAFELQSPYCCPRTPENVSSLSTGSILLIGLVAILTTYIIVGLTYNIAVRKAQGSDRVPNVMFWMALPGLIRDGFKFTASKLCGRRATYDNV